MNDRGRSDLVGCFRLSDRETSGDWQGLDSDVQVPRYLAIADMLRSAGAADNVLDVGCGEGILRSWLPKTGSYTGIEVSPLAARRAVDLQPSATVIRTAAEQFDPGTERFSSVVFNEMLYYAADPVGLVRKYAAVLLPTGVILCSIYHHPRSSSTKSRLRHLLDNRRPVSNRHCAEMVRTFMARESWEILDDRIIRIPRAETHWAIWLARPTQSST